MPLWLQGLLVALFWLAFWPAIGLWARRIEKSRRRARVEDLYPPRVHQTQTSQLAVPSMQATAEPPRSA